MAEETRKSRLQWVKRELEQVGVAMSVVGTRRQKLIEMARLATPAFKALKGDRPEVKKVRDEMRRRLHNLRHSQTTATKSSKNMWDVARSMDRVIELADKKMLDLPGEYKVGELTLLNSWGYTDIELKNFKAALAQATADLADFGLYESLVYGDVTLDPKKAPGSYLSYDRERDTMAANIAKAKSEGDIFRAFGDRLWSKLFQPGDRSLWGGPSHRSRFTQAFTGIVMGQPIDKETKARLQLTVGLISQGGWPQSAT